MKFKLWVFRTFWVKLYKEDAVYFGLRFYKNIYGDAINVFNARSIWIDKKGREYFIHDLIL